MKDKIIKILKSFAYEVNDPYGGSKTSDEMDYDWYADRIIELIPKNIEYCGNMPKKPRPRPLED